MHTPPPVPDLLEKLTKMAADVRNVLMAPSVQWLWRPDEASWSLTEVLCHLRDVEREVHQVRFEALIKEDNAFISGVAADEWAEERGYQSQRGEGALEDFVTARMKTVSLVEGLPGSFWERTGRHAFFGPTTLHELLNLVVRHDEIHWQQIQSLVKSAPDIQDNARKEADGPIQPHLPSGQT